MCNFRLVAHTQYMENYGAHSWNGEGECPQYWKFKGGYDYVVAVLPLEAVAVLGASGLQKLVDLAVEEFPEFLAEASEYSREYLTDWSLLAEGEETYDERMWREMDNVHRPTKTLEECRNRRTEINERISA